MRGGAQDWCQLAVGGKGEGGMVWGGITNRTYLSYYNNYTTDFEDPVYILSWCHDVDHLESIITKAINKNVDT